MKQRNHFSQIQQYYADLRNWLIFYKENHPERVIAGMFLILLIAVSILLITKATYRQSRSSAASMLVKRISVPVAIVPGKPITVDVIGLLSMYGKTQAITPDSLTLKDSLMIKELDKDIKRILNEKD